MNYDSPEEAPATESGSGPPLPSMDHGHVLGDGLCTPRGKAPAAEGPTACKPCLEKRRAVFRSQYAAAHAVGKSNGGANVDAIAIRTSLIRAGHRSPQHEQLRRTLLLAQSTIPTCSKSAERLREHRNSADGGSSPPKGASSRDQS